ARSQSGRSRTLRRRVATNGRRSRAPPGGRLTNERHHRNDHRQSPALPPQERSRRSEEHTSELQSRFDLVCRLLLEKKKSHTEIDPEVDQCSCPRIVLQPRRVGIDPNDEPFPDVVPLDPTLLVQRARHAEHSSVTYC